MPKLPEELHIFVPTRGRVNKQISVDQLGLKSIGYTAIVPECEAAKWGDTDHIVVPDSYKIADVRQEILQQPGTYHIVIDDDLKPALRRTDDPTKFNSFEQLSENERQQIIAVLFDDILRLLDSGWVHGGVAVRQGGNRNTDPYMLVTKVLRFHFYNAKVVRSLGHDYRPFTVKQDYDFTLALLCLGIPNIVINYCVQDQPGSNTEGGCSRYRTDNVLTAGALQLKDKYPDYVSVVTKAPKTAWKGMPRLDVNIQWKKAFKRGLAYARSLQRKDPASLDDKDRTVLRMQSQLPLLPHFKLEDYQ